MTIPKDTKTSKKGASKTATGRKGPRKAAATSRKGSSKAAATSRKGAGKAAASRKAASRDAEAPGWPGPPEVDVLVVGAGVAGLYAAWRLRTGERTDGKKLPKSIEVVEATTRVGGRLDTMFLDKLPDVAAEFGGMRYLESQLIVSNLITALELDHDVIGFPMGDSQNIFYLRGRRFRRGNLEHATTQLDFPYRLRAEERGRLPYDLFNDVIKAVLKEHGFEEPKTQADWAEVKERLVYRGMKLEEYGFWNLFADRVSGEAYQYLSDAGGYYSNVLNGSAGEGFEELLGDFIPSPAPGSHPQKTPPYLTLKSGYDQIVRELAKRLGGLKVPIHTQTRLKRLDLLDDGRVEATLVDAKGKASKRVASRVVLAMPRRSLELLDQDCFLFQDPQFAQDVRSVIPEPAVKIFLGFSKAWWRDTFQVASGESVSDLPLRQTYYFGVEDGTGDAHPGLMMAGYNDMWATSFWQGYASAPKKFSSTATERMMADREDPDIEKPSEAMVDEVLRQLCLIHGLDSIERPIVSGYRDWSKDPYGGGYHAWGPQADVKNIMRRMRQPIPGVPVHVIGEAYSINQGWVDGALCVAERFLQDHAGLAWPTWLKDYDLGW